MKLKRRTVDEEFLYFEEPYLIYELFVRDLTQKEIVNLMKELGCKEGSEVGSYDYKNICTLGLYDEDGDGNLEICIDEIEESYDDEFKLSGLVNEITAKAKKIEKTLRDRFVSKFKEDFLAYAKKNKIDAAINVKNVTIEVELYQTLDPKIEKAINKQADKYGLQIDIIEKEFPTNIMVLMLSNELADIYGIKNKFITDKKSGASIVPSLSGNGKRVIVDILKLSPAGINGKIPTGADFKAEIVRLREQEISNFRKLNSYMNKNIFSKNVIEDISADEGKNYYRLKVSTEFSDKATMDNIIDIIQDMLNCL